MTAFQAEGCGLPLCGNAYKISVTDLLSVPYGMISILRIGSLRSPPPFRLRPEGCGRLPAAGYVRFAQGATAPAALRVAVSPAGR